MGAANSGSRRRKSMQVATLFTGVAACTVGIAQAAYAMDAAPPAGGHTPNHPGQAARPDGRASGSIRYASSCFIPNIDKTWVHISVNSLRSDDPYRSFCFGFRGSFDGPPGVGINAYCAGNNYGYLMGLGGRSWSTRFTQGTTYHKLVEPHLDNVQIDGWAGNDTCGRPPNWQDMIDDAGHRQPP
jgi:hypothetical protein